MSRSRASLSAIRVALALLVLLASVAPVSARDMSVVVTTSSPRTVTAGYPVAYPVSATNTGKSTLNHVRMTGNAPASFTYLGAEPAASCSQTVAECVFGQVPAGAPLPAVIFYYRVPTTVGSYAFTATTIVNEGTGDNSDDNSQAADAFTSTPVVTNVVPVSTDFVSGHSIPGTRTFSTGLTNLGLTNQHGSQVVIGTNAEVTVADLPPASIALPCPAVAPTCFGWGTSLDVAQGNPIASGIEVTVRWDASELPNGMTAQKLKIIHLFTGGGYELVSNACTFGTNGLPTNLPCVKVAPFKFSDKDIQATILLLSNGVVRGW